MSKDFKAAIQAATVTEVDLEGKMSVRTDYHGGMAIFASREFKETDRCIVVLEEAPGIAVDGKLRGQGIGATITAEHAARWRERARAKNKPCVLIVSVESEAGAGLAEKVGFVCREKASDIIAMLSDVIVNPQEKSAYMLINP